MGETNTLPYHDMRGLLALLESEGQLRRITKPVEARYLNTLLAQADTALLMENVEGYSMPVVGGLVGSRQRVALGLGCDQRELGRRFMDALDNPIEAQVVEGGPAQEVVRIGDEVDLTELPIPFQHRKEWRPVPVRRHLRVQGRRRTAQRGLLPAHVPDLAGDQHRLGVAVRHALQLRGVAQARASPCPSPSPSAPARLTSSPPPTRPLRVTTSLPWPAPSTAGRYRW